MELPRLEPLWNAYRDKGLSVVAVERTRNTKAATTFIADKQLTYHLLEDAEGSPVVKEQFGVSTFPTSFLIDRDGRVMFVHVGFEEGDEKKLEQEILALMGGERPAAVAER